MERDVEVKVTASELRVLVYDYQNHFAAVVQTTSDEILKRERDLGMQEAAIRWKVNAIPAMEKAVFQTDPLAALGDAWALTIGMARYFDEGRGSALFGSSQALAGDAARRLVVEFDTLAVKALRSSEAEARARRWIEAWDRDNPITDLTFGRRSAMTEDSAITAAGLRASGLQAVGQLETTARDLSERLTVYFERLPKQIRWNTELVIIEVMREFGHQFFNDIGSIEGSAAGVRSFLDETPSLITTEREAVLQAMKQELGVTLESVDRQRVETLDVLQGERKAILDTLQAELDSSMASIRQERMEAFQELERLSQLTIETSTENAETLANGLIDRLFWRALLLIFIAAISLVLVAWIAARWFRSTVVAHRGA
jgi:hypothetical protein